VLNHFVPATKYHRWTDTQDNIIGREADLITNYDEPSAAVCEMFFDNDGDGLEDEDGAPPDGIDNDGDGLIDEDRREWHWLLVIGCAADGWPGTGGVNVFGLWIHDPGGWFTPIPAYVSSDIWKSKYFHLEYTDLDGISGYMHVEDPPENGPLASPPVRCEPPTKPHGTPGSLQQVQEIAQEGIALHLLNVTGPLASSFHQAQPGTPVLVRALSPQFGDYYLVPYRRAGQVTAMVIVEAATGQFHGAAACTVDWPQFPPLPTEQVRGLALVHHRTNIQRIELVWGFCEETLSPYTPLWRVTYADGETVFVSQQGTIHQELTKHSCLGGGRP